MESVLNTDVMYQGMKFHVQTEDVGLKGGYFQTQIYYRGKILSSERFYYTDLFGREDFSQILEERIEKEHKKGIERVEQGHINTRDINPILDSSHKSDRKSGKIKIVADANRFGRKRSKSKSLFEISSEESFVFNRIGEEDAKRAGLKRRRVIALLSLSLIFIISMIAFPKLESGLPSEERYNELMQQGTEMVDQGKHKKAEELLNRAVSLFPNRSQVYILRAHLFAEMGSTTQAIKELTLATELDPGNGSIFYELGGLHSEIRNDKDAIQSFIKAIEINYETQSLYDDLGAACFRENQFIEAEKYWMESLRINPDNPTVYYNLGLIGLKRESFGEAIHYFQRATEFDSGWVDAYIKLGDIYYLSGVKDKAGYYWKKAHDMNPEETVAQAKLQSLRQTLQ